MFDSSSCITVIIAVATLVLDIYICDELPQVHPHSVPHCLVNISKLSPLLIPYCKRQKAGWGLRNKVMMSLNTRLYTKLISASTKSSFKHCWYCPSLALQQHVNVQIELLAWREQDFLVHVHGTLNILKRRLRTTYRYEYILKGTVTIKICLIINEICIKITCNPSSATSVIAIHFGISIKNLSE